MTIRMNNAAEAMPADGTLTLRTQRGPDPGFVTIEIQDTGLGFSEENMKRIFTPFFTTKPIGKWTGLGLAIFYGIVKMHRGQVSVQSSEGEGTTFTIRLREQLPPKRSCQQAALFSSRRQGASLVAKNHKARANILIIHDEEGMREGCRRALAPAGYAIDTAPDLAAGQHLACSETYDLFLLDVMLPDGSGLDIIGSILHDDPNAICIVMTGFGSTHMAVEAVRLGAYDFLSKPFTSDELLMSVRQGLEHQRLKRIEAQAEELVLVQAELERLDEVKSQLMLQVAHELRAPVAAVQSYINLILTGYVSANELKPTLTRVQDRLQEMLDLISDLLELARLKQARQQALAEVSPQRMASILQEVCDLFREQAREKKQTFQVEILDQPVIWANKDHLRQIWTNLISNAIKYTPESGRVFISLDSDAGNLIGTVADSGIGIAEEDLPHLFKDFFRTDQAKASGQIGTGLGLSIVKQIVESYGGEVRVASNLHQGTRFTFILPLEPPPANSKELPSADNPPPVCRPHSPTSTA